MSKIMNSDFRKELYKNLTEAGYNKAESQRIIGIKYADALVTEVTGTLNGFIEQVKSGNYDLLNVDNVNAMLGELTKLQEHIK